jgi:hypothetical protein
MLQITALRLDYPFGLWQGGKTGNDIAVIEVFLQGIINIW